MGAAMRTASVALAFAVLLVLPGCGSMNAHVRTVQPSTASQAPAVVRPPAPPTPGAIFAAGSHRPLFEDLRARLAGDTLTIRIAEKTSASQSSNSSIDRQGAVEGSISALPFVSAGSFARASVSGASSNSFQGKGETGSDNVFTGDITVSVLEVLANGNLLVSGEKQVGLKGNVDVLRFSGIVNPRTIRPDNTVVSTQVADARLDFSGRGPVGEAQVMGWLSRFFMSFLPI